MTATVWCRCTNDTGRKPLPFLTPTNIIIAFVSDVTSDEEFVFLADQLWINIIMTIFTVLILTTNLVLTTNCASRTPFDEESDTRVTQLFTADMTKMILSQSICRITKCFESNNRLQELPVDSLWCSSTVPPRVNALSFILESKEFWILDRRRVVLTPFSVPHEPPRTQQTTQAFACDCLCSLFGHNRLPTVGLKRHGEPPA